MDLIGVETAREIVAKFNKTGQLHVEITSTGVVGRPVHIDVDRSEYIFTGQSVPELLRELAYAFERGADPVRQRAWHGCIDADGHRFRDGVCVNKVGKKSCGWTIAEGGPTEPSRAEEKKTRFGERYGTHGTLEGSVQSKKCKAPQYTVKKSKTPRR